ncbi:DUF58 domain-containing protein [Salinigranum halophilum]|uniref:DUF58 domain-containing protein n=1 Tax=Salinigranum halophilum TaxID=2565931 RepID=UPI0010A751CD|nr:DUF58 domain-containing protein [Salinigranum halophilum]
MRPTRRTAALAILGSGLLVFAVVLGRVELVIGGAALGAFLVSAQYRAVQTWAATDDALAITYALDKQRVTVDDTVNLTVDLGLSTPAAAPVTASLPRPVGARFASGTVPTVGIQPGATSASVSCALDHPVTGSVDLPRIEVEYTDQLGLFIETVTHGSPPSIRVDAKSTGDVHVGQGGRRFAASYGSHRSGETGAGLDPAEIRQYLPGDPVNRIDWQAYARLGEPYVREFEVESDQRTVIICDHSKSMAQEVDDAPAVAYVREVALGLASQAESQSDPLELYTVDDDGITSRRGPTTSTTGYRRIQQTLLNLDASHASTAVDRSSGSRVSQPDGVNTETPLEERLRPYLNVSGYVSRISSRPLFKTVQRALAEAGDRPRFIVVTDDADRTLLEELVAYLDGRGQLLLFVLPAVLFDPAAMRDLDDAYARYLDFESFRRRLSNAPGVDIYEVAPGERTDTILSAQSSSERAAATDGGRWEGDT